MNPLRILFAVLGILFLPLWPLHWLLCRLTAQRCPACGSKWRTELMGEWDGEDWHCHACRLWWTVGGSHSPGILARPTACGPPQEGGESCRGAP